MRQARRDGAAAEQFVLRWPYAKDDPSAMARARVVSSALEDVGFTAKPLPVTMDTFFSINQDPAAPLNIRSNSWCADWMSGSNWFLPLLHSGGDMNLAHLSVPAVDEDIDAVSRLPIDQQPAAWGALDEEIMTDYYPMVIFGGQSIGMLHGDQVAGMHIYPANQPSPTFKDIHVIP